MVDAWVRFVAFYDDGCLGQRESEGPHTWRVFELLGTEVSEPLKNPRERRLGGSSEGLLGFRKMQAGLESSSTRVCKCACFRTRTCGQCVL